ncbi:hypothetical protein J6590_069285 [Homalodisca vitripennis]|nr:hypothetical protein J6590_069285 [Homalodisca vitripennis]
MIMILTQASCMTNRNLPPSYRKSSCPDFGLNILPHCADHSLNKRYILFSILVVFQPDGGLLPQLSGRDRLFSTRVV